MIFPSLGNMEPLKGSGLRAITYLLRDEFTTSQSAPLTSPRNCEPTGTLTITDTGNYASITGGRLRIANGVSNFSNPRAIGGAVTRSVGKTVMGSVYYTASGIYLGFANSAAGGLAACEEAIYIVNNAGAFYYGGVSSIGTYFTSIAGVELQFAVVLRTVGAYLFIRAGNTGDWTLCWVSNTNSNATLYPAICRQNTAGQIEVDSFRALDISTLDSRFASDYALATSRFSGSVSAGTTFTHEANNITEFTVTTRPSAGNMDVPIRRQDASNNWIARVNSAGDFSLQEVVAGTPTPRGNAAAVVTNGHRVLVVADGTTIRGYSNNVLRWTYSSATNFQTATAGAVSSLGTGGVLSDLSAWPRAIAFPREF